MSSSDFGTRTVRSIMFRRYLTDAIKAEDKDETRRLMLPDNSVVVGAPPNAGFKGIDLDSGRGNLNGEVRARRTFENKQVRVVSIQADVKAGDLFWVKHGRFGKRADSDLTLEVTRVRGSRLQDFTIEDALREGVKHLPEKLRDRNDDPREAFANLWDDIHGDDEWASVRIVPRGAKGRVTWRWNPWVWVYRFKPWDHNIDSDALIRSLTT